MGETKVSIKVVSKQKKTETNDFAKVLKHKQSIEHKTKTLKTYFFSEIFLSIFKKPNPLTPQEAKSPSPNNA